MEETLLRESLIGIAKLLRKNQEMQFMLQREMANLYRHLAIPSDPQSLAVGVADPVAVQQGKALAALDQIILKLGGSPHKPIE